MYNLDPNDPAVEAFKFNKKNYIKVQYGKYYTWLNRSNSD